MKRFIEGQGRDQATLFPECLEDWIDEDNTVRVVDTYVDGLDLGGLDLGGLGGMLGVPTGASMKFRLGDPMAIDLAVGGERQACEGEQGRQDLPRTRRIRSWGDQAGRGRLCLSRSQARGLVR